MQSLTCNWQRKNNSLFNVCETKRASQRLSKANRFPHPVQTKKLL